MHLHRALQLLGPVFAKLASRVHPEPGLQQVGPHVGGAAQATMATDSHGGAHTTWTF